MQLPHYLWIGRTRGEWPIQCFANEEQAMTWLKNAGPQGEHKLWKIVAACPEELELVMPEPFLKKVEE